MAVRYSAAALEEVRANIDWQPISTIEAAYSASRISWDPNLVSAGWHDAAMHILRGQQHNRDVMRLYLRYMPYAVNYAFSRIGRRAGLDLPNFDDNPPRYSDADLALVRMHVDWGLQNEPGKTEEGVAEGNDNDWWECADELLGIQKHTADAVKLYLRYFPAMASYAASRIGSGIPISPPDLESV